MKTSEAGVVNVLTNSVSVGVTRLRAVYGSTIVKVFEENIPNGASGGTVTVAVCRRTAVLRSRRTSSPEGRDLRLHVPARGEHRDLRVLERHDEPGRHRRSAFVRS